MTKTSYIIKTPAGYLGAFSLGEILTNCPKTHAYCYKTIEDAEQAARIQGVETFEVEPLEIKL